MDRLRNFHYTRLSPYSKTPVIFCFFIYDSLMAHLGIPEAAESCLVLTAINPNRRCFVCQVKSFGVDHRLSSLGFAGQPGSKATEGAR